MSLIPSDCEVLEPEPGPNTCVIYDGRYVGEPGRIRMAWTAKRMMHFMSFDGQEDVERFLSETYWDSLVPVLFADVREHTQTDWELELPDGFEWATENPGPLHDNEH